MPVKQMFRAAADWICSSGPVMDKWGENPHLGKVGNYLASPQIKLLMAEMVSIPAVAAAATGFTSLPDSAITSSITIAFSTFAARALFKNSTKDLYERLDQRLDAGNYYVTTKPDNKPLDPKIILENQRIAATAKLDCTSVLIPSTILAPVVIMLTGDVGAMAATVGFMTINPVAHWYRAQQILNGRWSVKQKLPPKPAPKKIELPVLFRPQMQPGFAFRQASPSA